MARIKGSDGPSLGIAAPAFNAPLPSQRESGLGMTRLGMTMGEISEQFARANHEADFITASAGQFADLKQGLDSLHDEQDPEALKSKWEDVKGQVRERYASGFKDSPLGTKLDAHFARLTGEMDSAANSLYRSRTMDQGLAKLDGSLNTLAGTLTTAKGTQDFIAVQNEGLAKIDEARAAGFMGALKHEELRQKFQDSVRTQQDAWSQEQHINGVYASLFQQFGGNADAVVRHLDDPKNREAQGVSWKEANELIKRFEQKAARDKRRADDARIAGERNEKELYYRAVEKNDLDGAAAILAKSRNIPGAERLQMRQAIAKDQWNDDPRIAADVQRKVWMGEITDVSQLTPLVGNGLSLKTARTLREDVEKMNKEAPDFPGAMNFYGNALARYKAVYKDTPMAEQEAKFAQTLAWQAKQQKIGPFDARMDGLADELLKVAEKSWFIGKDKTQFEKQFEDGNLPGVPKPGQAMPAPARAPAATLAEPAPQIPREQYDAVKQALARAGKDTSDATVTAVWKANRDKMKGAK